MQRIDTHATFDQLTENIYHTMFNTNQNISGSKMMLRVSLMESARIFGFLKKYGVMHVSSPNDKSLRPNLR